MQNLKNSRRIIEEMEKNIDKNIDNISINNNENNTNNITNYNYNEEFGDNEDLKNIINNQELMIKELNEKLTTIQEIQKKNNPKELEFSEIEEVLFKKFKSKSEYWESIKPLCLKKENKNNKEWDNFKEQITALAKNKRKLRKRN